MQAFGFDEENPGQATPLPPPEGGTASPKKDALVAREDTRGTHRPIPAAVSAAPNLVGLVNALRRRWPLALTLGILLGVTIGVSTWFLRPVTYTGRVSLRVEANPQGIVFPSQDGPRNFPDYQRNQMQLVKIRPVLNAALRKQELASLPIIREQVDPIDWLEKKIRADFPAPEILRIAITGDNQKDLVLLVEAVCAAYLEEVVYKENDAKLTRLSKLKEFHLRSEEDLRNKKNTLKDMAKRLGGVDAKVLGERQKLQDEYLQMLRKEMMAKRAKLQEAEAQLGLLIAKEKAVDKLNIPPEKLNALIMKDPVIEQNLKENGDLEKYLEAYRKRSPHPDQEPNYIRAIQKLDRNNKAIEARKEKVRPQLEKDWRASERDSVGDTKGWAADTVILLRNQVKDLETKHEEQARKVQDFGDNAVDMDFYQKEIDSLENLAKEIAKQKQVLEIEMDAPSRIKKLEDGIAVPNTTEAGRAWFAIMVGFGTLFGTVFGIAFLEFKARRVSHVEEVTQGLKIHLMGSLPNVPKRALAGSSAPRDVYWQNRLTESVDAIRTTLMNAARFEGLRVVMVTSAVGGEGKTLLACHLAASLARAGLKTLLIDGDMRRPAVHRLFGLPLPRGLAELLQGEIEPADATHTGLMDGLSVISAGQRDGRSGQALAGQRIREVLDQLRGSYDFIVVDSAPVLPVADSQLIGQHTDGVVFSIMRDVSRLPQVYAAYERLAVLRIRTLGAVVNGVSSGTYGSGDYYYIASTPAEPAPAG
jgi:polysaccharide biosynthesis transport protein